MAGIRCLKRELSAVENSVQDLPQGTYPRARLSRAVSERWKSAVTEQDSQFGSRQPFFLGNSFLDLNLVWQILEFAVQPIVLFELSDCPSMMVYKIRG